MEPELHCPRSDFLCSRIGAVDVTRTVSFAVVGEKTRLLVNERVDRSLVKGENKGLFTPNLGPIYVGPIQNMNWASVVKLGHH